MRIFVAVFPPPETQQAAYRRIERLRRSGDGVSWVKLENIHFTLRFLGELGEKGAGRVAQAAREAAADCAEFECELGPLGAFPDARRPRVIWIGMKRGGEELKALAASLERTLRRRGFDRSERPFAPHLTLGRVRDSGTDWTAALAAGEAQADETGAGFSLVALRVIESTLSPHGSIYRVFDEAPLRR